MSEPERQSSATPRFQFSLRTALLLIAFAAVGFSLWISFGQWRENRRLRAELIRMKDRAGEIEVAPGEEHKVHAVRMQTLEPMTWKWNVYIPNGREIHLRAGTKLDKRSFGDSGIEAGNHTITVALRRNHLNEWKLILADVGGNSNYQGPGDWQIGISDELAKRIEGPNYASSSGVTGNAAAEPGIDLELLRYRMELYAENGPVRVANDFLQGPHEGILIWITEK
jgi:hypothetical protein